jgi:hypothetical protein
MATFDYTSRDYLSIRQDLVNRAALNIQEWDSADASEFGNVFIDLWAYMGDVLHFYIDRAASETFLSTATQRESVLAIANLMDYSPASARGSRGTCTVRLTSFPPENVKNYTVSSAACATATINGTSQAVITFTTSSNHELTPNQLVTVSGLSPTSFNIANAVIYDAPTATTFRILASQYTTTPPSTGTSTTAGGSLDYNLVYIIPQNTVFNAYDTNGDLVDFYLPTATTVDRTNTNTILSLVQGKFINTEILGSSTGRSNQVFTLSKAKVDDGSISIQVFEGALSGGSPTAITYQYVTNLSSSIYADKVFTTRLTSEGYTQIIFGNGFNGSIPTTNSSMVATYRTTVGPLGNLSANKMRFITGAPSAYLSIESSSIFSGGADVESLESIRNNVSRLFRTQDRAVSLQDYKDLTLQTPGVSKATAVYGQGGIDTVSGAVSGTTVTFTSSSAHGLVAGQKVTITNGTGASYRGTDLIIQSVPTPTTFTINTASYGSAPTSTTTGATATAGNSVILYPVPHLSTFPPAPITAGSQKVVIEIPTPMAESIDNYFSTRSMLSVSANTINPTNHGTIDKYIECTPVYVGMQVYVRNNFVSSWVKDAVTEAIKKLLLFENVYFGQTLTIGEVYRAALSINGVDYVVLTNLSKTYGATSLENVTTDSTKLLCFTDGMTAAPDAVTLVMSGGITGSN